MEKYLVFRLEKPLYENEPHRDQSVIPCFELVKEFEIKSSWVSKARIAAEDYASKYSKDNSLRTVVIKGSVFG